MKTLKLFFSMIKTDIWGSALRFFILGFMIWVLETGYFAFVYGYHFAPINTYEYIWDKTAGFFWFLSYGLGCISFIKTGKISFDFTDWKIKACTAIVIFIFLSNTAFHIFPSLTQK